jgi:uncharacterized damage-inducible protein DinB
MLHATYSRPATQEYPPSIAGYVEQVPNGRMSDILQAQLTATQTLLWALPVETLQARPTPTDWNILEVIGHITDVEQIFASRALRIARGDTSPQPGFDQDAYVAIAQSAQRTIGDLLDAYAAQRRATIAMLRSFDEVAWQRMGIVSDAPISVRACIYMIAGHELYHIADFHERYGI